MKTSLRMALLLGLLGGCYLLGRWHAAALAIKVKPTAAEQTKTAEAPKSKQTKGPYFVTLADLRRLLSNPHLTGEDLYYFETVLLPGMDPKDMPGFIKLIADLPEPLDSVEVKTGMLVGLFKSLAKENPKAALALLPDFPQGANEFRSDVIEEALGTMVASDPQQAFSLLAQYQPGALDFNNDPVYNLLFGYWAFKKPVDAAAAAVNLPAGYARSAILKIVGSAWVSADPQAAITWAQSLPAADANVLDAVLQRELQVNAGKDGFDPQVALNEINQVNDLSERNILLDQVAAGLSEGRNGSYQTNEIPVIDWVNQNLSGVAYDEEVNQLFSNPSYYSPTMLPALDKITDPGAREAAIDDLATHWRQSSPTDALAWAQTLPEADATARTGAIDTILTSLSKTNPTAAAAFVENAADPSAYLSAAPAIAQNLAATDPEAALDWAGNLPDGTEKDQAIGNALGTLAKTDPTAAWDYANSLPAGSAQDTVMDSIVTTTAQKDPAEAAALAEQIPAGGAQLSAISSLSATWVAQDPQTFTVWLNGLPDGDQRDTAVAQLVASTQTAKDPADVLAWANSVGDTQARASEITTVLTTWAAQDPTAAMNAAQTANLSDEQRTALVQKLSQASGSK